MKRAPGLLGLSLTLVSSATAQQPSSAPAPATTVVLRAARLIDGTGAPATQDAVVVVTGNAISAVGKWGAVTVPANAQVIDLGDVTLLPGLIDAHVHLIGRTLGDPKHDDAVVRDYQAMSAILGVPNAEQTLLAGFTSVRNVGAPDFQDMALRQAINEGRVPGPRMEAAGEALG